MLPRTLIGAMSPQMSVLQRFGTPALDLNLAGDSTLDTRITATRASTKTYFDSTGTMQTAAVNEFPREYDPATLQCLGRSFWEARTNLLLNSLIDGTNLSTQSITTTAAARTLSFYGTGTVTLSGTHSATVVGTGAFPTRTTYTYTPTAGTLTLTVSGTVQYANDELGATATPFIPTAGASVTRAADVASMTGTNFSSWYNQTEGTFLVTAMVPSLTASGEFRRAIQADNGSSTHYMAIEYFLASVNRTFGYVNTASVEQANLNSTSTNGNTVAGTPYTSVLAYKANDFAASHLGTSVLTDTAGTVPSASQLMIGQQHSATNQQNGFISRIVYWSSRLPNTDLQILSRST